LRRHGSAPRRSFAAPENAIVDYVAVLEDLRHALIKLGRELDQASSIASRPKCGCAPAGPPAAPTGEAAAWGAAATAAAWYYGGPLGRAGVWLAVYAFLFGATILFLAYRLRRQPG
jgi:hypothetical protein